MAQQMLWEKAIRCCMLGHAGFLVMTAFALSHKTLAEYLNIHLVIFGSNSTYLSKQSIGETENF